MTISARKKTLEHLQKWIELLRLMEMDGDDVNFEMELFQVCYEELSASRYLYLKEPIPRQTLVREMLVDWPEYRFKDHVRMTKESFQKVLSLIEGL